jgi:hypothetical protein
VLEGFDEARVASSTKRTTCSSGVVSKEVKKFGKHNSDDLAGNHCILIDRIDGAEPMIAIGYNHLRMIDFIRAAVQIGGSGQAFLQFPRREYQPEPVRSVAVTSVIRE